MTIKKIFVVLLIILTFGIGGCASLRDPEGYNEVQKAKWNAMGLAASAANSKIENKIAEINPDSGVITIYNQNRQQVITLNEKRNAFVDGLDTVLNSGAVKLVTGGIAFKLATENMQGNYKASGGGDINVTRDSGNVVDVDTNHIEDSDGATTTESIDSGNDSSDGSAVTTTTTEDNKSNYDNDSRTNYDNDSRTNYDNDSRTDYDKDSRTDYDKDMSSTINELENGGGY